jgi:putative hydrolase of the HAD superfamily
MTMMNNAQGPAAILFDFGGTLDADGVAWKDRLRRLWCEEVGEIAPEQFDPVFYAVDDALVGTIPATLSFRDTVGKITRGLSKAMGGPDDVVVARIAKRFVEESLGHLHGNALVLRDLSRRYRLGIVSNFYGNLSAVCREVGLSPFLSVIIDSTVVGVLKPNPEIFHAALRMLQIEPAQAVFVGDSLQRDMVGARAVGMAHVWLTPKSFQDGKACCPNDPVAHQLKEVGALYV